MMIGGSGLIGGYITHYFKTKFPNEVEIRAPSHSSSARSRGLTRGTADCSWASSASNSISFHRRYHWSSLQT